MVKAFAQLHEQDHSAALCEPLASARGFLVWRLARSLIRDGGFEEVFSHGCEDVDEHDLFVHHRRAVQAVWRKVQHVARQRDALRPFDEESHAAADDDRHLFVWMRVFRRDEQRRKTKAANHHLFADDHLPFDAFRRTLDRYSGPVEMSRVA